MTDPWILHSIWLFVVVFMLHDFEEIISVEHWADNKKHLAQSTLQKKIWSFWNVNSYLFAKRDILVFGTIAVISAFKAIFSGHSIIDGFYIGFLIIVSLHNIVHIVQSIMMRSYTPGFYTGTFLVTPYTIYLFIIL